MTLKKTLCSLLFAAVSTSATANITIHHKEGSAPIGPFDLKVVSLSGITCFEKTGITELTQQITIHEDELLTCGAQDVYNVYGQVPGYVYNSGFIYYGNKPIKQGESCTISHEKDGYISTRLAIKCGS